MFPKRTGLIVWVKDTKLAKNLDRFGNIHYISKRLNYVIIYVNQAKVKEIVPYLEKMNFVKKVEKSYRNEINTEFS